MAPTRRDQVIQELFKRRDSFTNPRQRAAFDELQKRGVFEADSPAVQKTVEQATPVDPVLPSGVTEDDFQRIQRTGLTPGTAVQFAGVSIATENARRKQKGIDLLSAQQQEARLRVFQQQAGVPEAEVVDQFQVKQEQQRTQRSLTLGGRLQSAGTGALTTIGATGTDVIGLFAPETARQLSEEFRTILNPDGSRAGKAGALLGELAKVTTFAKTGPAGLALIFGAQGAGAVRQEVSQARQEGRDISGTREAVTAGLVGGVEAASGFIAGKIFGSLGKTLGRMNPITRIGLLQGKEAAVRAIVKTTLKTVAGVAAEGADEGLTQLITNKIRQGIKPELALTEGVVEAAATGLLLAPFGAAGSRSSLLGRSQVAAEAQTAPAVEAPQEAAVAPAEATPTVTPETQVPSPEPQIDDTSTQPVAPSDTTEQSISDPTAPDVTVSQEGEVSGPAIAKPTPVDESGTPQTAETPAQSIQRTAGQISPEGTTSARKVDIAANRKAMNNLLIEQANVRTWEEAQATAQEQNIPDKAMTIARGIEVVPRAMSDIETAGMTQRVVAIIAEHNDLNAQLDKANPIEAQLITAELQRLEQDHDALSRAQSISNTEGGRALNAIKLTLNQNFEQVAVIGRAKRAKGADLSLTDRSRIKKLTDDVKRLEKRLQSLQGKKPSKSKVLNRTRNQQLEKLTFEKSEVQGRINRLIQGLKPRSIFENLVREPLSIMKALKSSFDVSAPGRQAAPLVAAKPITAIKAMRPMFQALVSEKAQFRINESIVNDPDFPLAKQAGLRITDTSNTGNLSDKEENYRSRLAEFIPGVRASERAFTTFLNVIRLQSFKNMIVGVRNGTPTAVEAAGIADAVNNFSGFGGLSDQTKSLKLLNTILWSPSLQLARFQVITGKSLRKAPTPAVQKEVAKLYGRSMLGLSTMIALGLLAGFDVEFDTRSSDFIKLKFGDTRIDIGAGLFQFLVLATRTLSGQTKSPFTGKVTDLRGPNKPFASRGVFGTISDFGRQKLTPGLGLAIDLLHGQNVIREPVTDAKGVSGLLPTIPVKTLEGAKNVVVNALVPLAIDEVVSSFKEQNIPTAVGLGILTEFGVGVQNFGSKPKKKKKRRRSSRRRN